MRNLNKKQNLLEQARINLDKEKISHSITQVRVEELKSIIKEAREYIVSQKLHKIVDTTGGLTYEERKLLEILDKVEGDK